MTAKIRKSYHEINTDDQLETIVIALHRTIAKKKEEKCFEASTLALKC